MEAQLVSPELKKEDLKDEVVNAIDYVSSFFDVKNKWDLREACENLEIQIADHPVVSDHPVVAYYTPPRRISLTKTIKKSDIGHEAGHFLHYFINPCGFEHAISSFRRFDETGFSLCYTEVVADFAEFVYVFPDKIRIKFGEIVTDIEKLYKNRGIGRYLSERSAEESEKFFVDNTNRLCSLHVLLRRHLDEFERKEVPIGVFA